MSTNQLHSLLAVEQDLVQQNNNVFSEASSFFVKKSDHFDGIKKVYVSKEADSELVPPEGKEVISTVQEQLGYIAESFVKALDATVSKEQTNSSGNAKASLLIGTTEFSLSATSLLAMEKYLTKYRDLCKVIPSLDESKVWSKDDSTTRAIKKTDKQLTYRSMKRKVPLVLSQATEKFPAQVQIQEIDVQVGAYEQTLYSGRITSLEKSNLLAKIDSLLLAVKTAREEANQTEAVQIKIGQVIIDYLGA
jgi:hypothetical protein